MPDETMKIDAEAFAKVTRMIGLCGTYTDENAVVVRDTLYTTVGCDWVEEAARLLLLHGIVDNAIVDDGITRTTVRTPWPVTFTEMERKAMDAMDRTVAHEPWAGLKEK